MAEISIRQWIENYNSGKYDSQDVKVQGEAGWYDWFCRDKSLCGKTKRLAPKVKQLAKSSKVDVNNWYVWFKNNCPCCAPLYDDFRLEPLDEDRRDELYFGVCCGHPHGSEFMYEIFTARSGYKTEFKCKNKREVLNVIEQLASEFQN